MIKDKKIIVVMPAYNAESTLRQTYEALPHDIVDDVILVDDASPDDTVRIAGKIGINHVHVHNHNLGYGGNQKTCYAEALALGADITVMVHPDSQYTPKLIRSMCSLIAEGVFDCVLGSRILGGGALKGGMPRHKYVANRLLTAIQNLLAGSKLSEFHTGYRAFSREILETLPLERNSDDFIFDNQMLLQILAHDYTIGEITCPTSYFDEASSIGGWPVVKYGLGVLFESVRYRTDRWGITRSHYY
jgi:glycosyltransferase involved in cell wall biosynthesis